MAKATLSPVQFHGSTIFVATHKGEPYAPIKPIVEDMGLTWEAQARKLRDNRDRWGMINMIIPSASGNQDTLCMPVRKLPAFFASINPNKVRPELRDRIRLYQDECDDALWNYWTKGQATRKPKAALPAPAQLSLPAAGVSIDIEERLTRCEERLHVLREHVREEEKKLFVDLIDMFDVRIIKYDRWHRYCEAIQLMLTESITTPSNDNYCNPVSFVRVLLSAPSAPLNASRG
ncbi:phage antirepressor N-terminal domain-containing protein [Bilophila wadsworthia]|uniref:phage antirepressor N-terminal domain-containing protein n=2 Tax=Bilophila wadsworthia TaxID=35833 RepID=UPI00242F672B|nr:phage antirepressor N-terminal domain-containing protein [Bilophila wadsworthia]